MIVAFHLGEEPLGLSGVVSDERGLLVHWQTTRDGQPLYGVRVPLEDARVLDAVLDVIDRSEGYEREVEASAGGHWRIEREETGVRLHVPEVDRDRYRLAFTQSSVHLRPATWRALTRRWCVHHRLSAPTGTTGLTTAMHARRTPV